MLSILCILKHSFIINKVIYSTNSASAPFPSIFLASLKMRKKRSKISKEKLGLALINLNFKLAINSFIIIVASLSFSSFISVLMSASLPVSTMCSISSILAGSNMPSISATCVALIFS